ncbi:hypothetical protein [Haladaptatus halobius]|uniref:hypothetical protein n=1 Tax=Haladaptatus halobius TaxID=2884875 RepID=UPI001D09C99B|nr:hypothetical protein [Haladaptatus halobius]
MVPDGDDDFVGATVVPDDGIVGIFELVQQRDRLAGRVLAPLVRDSNLLPRLRGQVCVGNALTISDGGPKTAGDREETDRARSWRRRMVPRIGLSRKPFGRVKRPFDGARRIEPVGLDRLGFRRVRRYRFERLSAPPLFDAAP